MRSVGGGRRVCGDTPHRQFLCANVVTTTMTTKTLTTVERGYQTGEGLKKEQQAIRPLVGVCVRGWRKKSRFCFISCILFCRSVYPGGALLLFRVNLFCYRCHVAKLHHAPPFAPPLHHRKLRPTFDR